MLFIRLSVLMRVSIFTVIVSRENTVRMATNESGEKRLATTVPYTSIMTHTKDVKRTVSDILGKVETKGPSYSELLDGFSVLTGQLNTLSKTVANEKGEFVRKWNCSVDCEGVIDDNSEQFSGKFGLISGTKRSFSGCTSVPVGFLRLSTILLNFRYFIITSGSSLLAKSRF